MSQKQFPTIPTYGFLRSPQVLAIFPKSKISVTAKAKKQAKASWPAELLEQT